MRRRAALAARALRIEPGIDVAFAKSPLAADADRRNLPRLDQTIDRAQVDLEIFEDFLGRQEDLVVRKVDAHQVPDGFYSTASGDPAGNVIVNTAPP